jgi:UDP-glucose 4-epimerase
LIKRVGITGPSGFVGKILVNELIKAGYLVDGFTTNKFLLSLKKTNTLSYYPYEKLIENQNAEMFRNLDALIIAHGIAHTSHNTTLNEAYKVNYLDVTKITDAGYKNNLKKVIFISSVNSHASKIKNAASVQELSSNQNDYLMQLKGTAEAYLSETFQAPGKLIILKPSLMYGKGMKGSLKFLYTLSNCGLPLPFRGILARRSYFSVINFSKLVVICLGLRLKENVSLLAADDDALNVMELSKALNKSVFNSIFLRKQEYYREYFEVVRKA